MRSAEYVKKRFFILESRLPSASKHLLPLTYLTLKPIDSGRGFQERELLE